jgi:hypothetical protein
MQSDICFDSKKAIFRAVCVRKNSGCRYVKHTGWRHCARLKGIYRYRLKLSDICIYHDAFYHSSWVALLNANVYIRSSSIPIWISACSRMHDIHSVKQHSLLWKWHISSRNMQGSIYFKLLHFKYTSTVSEFCCSCMNSVCPQYRCVL